MRCVDHNKSKCNLTGKAIAPEDCKKKKCIRPAKFKDCCKKSFEEGKQQGIAQERARLIKIALKYISADKLDMFKKQEKW